VILLAIGMTPVARGADTAVGKPLMPILNDDGTFNYGNVLIGKISGPPTHGVEFSKGAVEDQGLPVTKPMSLNVENYHVAGTLNGLYVPRKMAEQKINRLNENTMRLQIEPYENWKVHTEVLYTLLPDCVVQAKYTFTCEQDYPQFEVFISSYFHGCYPPYMRLNGKWQRAEIVRANNPCEHRYWCRDEKTREQLKAKMPQRLKQYDEVFGGRDKSIFVEAVDERCYTEPLIVTPIHGTGYAVVHWIERESCMSLSANNRNGAHDFCLVGRDVKKGQTVTCYAWMAYRKLPLVQNESNWWVPSEAELNKALEWVKTLKPAPVAPKAGR